MNYKYLGFLVVISISLFNCSKGLEATSPESAASNGGNLPGTGTVPIGPSQLSVQALSANQIRLSWVDNSTDETGFRVERAFATAGPFSSGMGPFTVLATTANNIQTYTDSNLQPATQYYYRVSAVNGALRSAVSNQATTSTQNVPLNPPSPPSLLTAQAGAATIINLSWTDNSNNESTFKIEKSINGGATFSLIATTSADVTSYQDYNLNASTAYSYRVRASNSVGDSNYANTATATTLAAGNTITYAYISTNIIGPNCVSCHGPALAASGVNLSTYNSVFAGRNAMLNAIKGGRMPPGGALTSQQIAIVDAWVNLGAPNN